MSSKFDFLFGFVQDLVYDRVDKDNFVDAKFNPRKFTVLLVIISLFFLSSFLLNRTVNLTRQVFYLEAQITNPVCLLPPVVVKPENKKDEKP